MKKSILFISALFICLGVLKAQQPNFEEFVPISGEQNPYEKKAVEERIVVEYPYLQEADVKYNVKIHRIIDTRQKMNHILEWPKNPLNQYIYNFAVDGTLKAYKNDSLYSWFTPEEIIERSATKEMQQIIDPNADPDDPDYEFMTIDSLFVTPFDHSNIVKYMLLEDWFFDHKHSLFKPRIMAIAPLFDFKTSTGEVLQEDIPMFWLKMNDLRPLLKNLELYNTVNDAARISYDHFFQMRLFDSYIIKRSNMYDLEINQIEDFKDDSLAALLEGERIKNDLFIFEHDLWEY